ncbi:MAG: hypothetical protein R3208_22350, partial [Ketobacteraceae bacterium]|nr:hypothetical protein [Ketobacteraceae bacterium]
MAIIIFFILNILLAFGFLLVTFLWPSTHLLARVSVENGPYEVATALILLTGSLLLLYRGIQHQRGPNHRRLVVVATIAMALLCFVGAGEEISWGQHWLQFQAGEFFTEHNHQKETNLHNLMPAVVFSTLINVVIYGGFTLLPLLHWAV